MQEKTDKKIAVITGGSSGIGKKCCELFTQNGIKVYELSRHGESTDEVTHINCDVTDRDACVTAIDQVINAEGHIDILVSNAGMGISGAIEFTKQEDFLQQMNVNFNGAVYISMAVIKYMRQADGGRIIFTGSMAGECSIPFQAFYSASKAAIASYAMALVNELRPFGIRISVVMPGDIKTGFTGARRKNMEGVQIYERMERAVSQMEHDEQTGMAPERIAALIYRQAVSRRPAMKCTLGFIYKFERLLVRIFPTRLAEYIIYRMY